MIIVLDTIIIIGQHGSLLFREVSKHLDHYPLMSDLEPGAVQVSVSRSWKQPVRYCQASYDGALIDFFFTET